MAAYVADSGDGSAEGERPNTIRRQLLPNQVQSSETDGGREGRLSRRSGRVGSGGGGGGDNPARDPVGDAGQGGNNLNRGGDGGDRVRGGGSLSRLPPATGDNDFDQDEVGRYFERAPVVVSQDISDDGTTLSTMSEDEDPENVRWTRFALDLEDQELPRLVIHPNSRFRTIFDIVVAMAITYNALVLPFRVCFNVDADGWLLALESLMDLLFLVDLVLNFRTAIITRGRLVSTGCAIAKHYLKGWFWVDFTSAIPIDLLIMAMTDDDRNVSRIPRLIRVIRLIRLIRMLKLFRLSRIYRKWEAHIPVGNGVFRLLKLLLTLLVMSHFLACGFFLIAALQDFEGTWVDANDLTGVWVTYQYMAAVYWAATAVTTVGFGDVSPQTFWGRVYAIVSLSIGVSIFSYTVGVMSFLVARMEATTNQTQEKLDAVNFYMKYRKFPKDLRIAIREYYLFAWSRVKASQDEIRMLDELSPSLRDRVAEHLKATILAKVPLFRNTSHAFALELIRRIHTEAATPGDFIIKQGEPAEAMYIVHRGHVQLCSPDGEVVFDTLREGACFGHTGFFVDSQLNPTSVRASRLCEFDVVSRDDFREVLRMFPEDRAKLSLVTDADKKLRTLNKRRRRFSMSSQGAEMVAAMQRAQSERRPPSASASAPGVVRRNSLTNPRARHASIDSMISNESEITSNIDKFLTSDMDNFWSHIRHRHSRLSPAKNVPAGRSQRSMSVSPSVSRMDMLMAERTAEPPREVRLVVEFERAADAGCFIFVPHGDTSYSTVVLRLARLGVEERDPRVRIQVRVGSVLLPFTDNVCEGLRDGDVIYVSRATLEVPGSGGDDDRDDNVERLAGGGRVAPASTARQRATVDDVTAHGDTSSNASSPNTGRSSRRQRGHENTSGSSSAGVRSPVRRPSSSVSSEASSSSSSSSRR